MSGGSGHTMEVLSAVFEIGKNMWKGIKWLGYISRLDENMQSLKRKRDDLSCQEDDINAEVANAELHPGKRRKKEVENWLRNVEKIKFEIQRLEGEIVGVRGYVSRARLGKLIEEKIEEVAELQKKGRFSNPLVLDTVPSIGQDTSKRRFISSTTTETNLGEVWLCLMGDEVGRIGIFGIGGDGKATVMHNINNQLLKETRKTDMINDIVDKSKNWKVHVQVTRKQEPKEGKLKEGASKQKRFQSLTLCDAQGTEVSATIFDDDIAKREGSLIQNRFYSIQNASVRSTPKRFRHICGNFQWIIDHLTTVQELPQTEGFDRYQAYQFTPFDEFQGHLNRNAEINVLAVVVHVLPPKQITANNVVFDVRELILIDPMLKPITLTLWNQFVDIEGTQLVRIQNSAPILICLRLKVTSYNGLSLSTSPNSTINFNPQTTAAVNLQNWCRTQSAVLQSIPRDIPYYIYEPYLPTPPTEITPIIDLPTSTTRKENRWVRAHATITNFNQRFWFLSCSKCHYPTRGERAHVITCKECNALAHAEPRCRVEIELQDSTAEIDAIIYGHLAERLLSIKASTLADYTSENYTVALEAFDSRPPTKIHSMKLRLQKKDSRMQVTVISVDVEEDEGKNMSNSTALELQRTMDVHQPPQSM